MSKRTAKVNVAPEEVSFAEMHKALEKYVGLHCEMEVIMASAKAEVERLKKETADKLKPLAKKLEAHQDVVQAYAMQHKEDFVKVRKQIVYGGHKIGFQTTPPAVQYCKPLEGSGKQNDSGFLAACRAFGDWAMKFVRTVEEPDKEAILTAHREAKAKAEETDEASALEALEYRLAKLGVKVTGGEVFVIDLNLQPES